MSARRKLPAKKPVRPVAEQTIAVTSSSDDDEDTSAKKKRAYDEVVAQNSQLLDETCDEKSEDGSEPNEYTVAKSKHLLPKSASLEGKTYQGVPKCLAFDPLTPQATHELKTPLSMYTDGRKFRLRPVKLVIPDSPFKVVRGDCCDGLHYGRVKVGLVYQLGYSFDAFLSHSAITRLASLEADDFFHTNMTKELRRERLRKQQAIFEALLKARNPYLLASYTHGQILISSVSFTDA